MHLHWIRSRRGATANCRGMIPAANPADFKRGAFTGTQLRFSSGLSGTSYSPSSGSLMTAGHFVVLLLFVALFVVVIVVVWVSRWHRIADKLQPDETVFRGELDHAGITRADPRRFRAVPAAGKPRNRPGYSGATADIDRQLTRESSTEAVPREDSAKQAGKPMDAAQSERQPARPLIPCQSERSGARSNTCCER